ncbi:MAG: hypothetical protein EXQ99_08135 [Alphaproteobacteria bacterium]|nr:hypothetical protein [Alphaproteobacteria bacterium]
MIDTLWGLALAVAAFFGIHLIPVVPGLRARLIARLTRRVYRGLFSLLSIAAFGWLIAATSATAAGCCSGAAGTANTRSTCTPAAAGTASAGQT